MWKNKKRNIFIINVPNGKKISVTTENYRKKNVYIQAMSLNGKKYNKTIITYDDINNGVEI